MDLVESLGKLNVWKKGKERAPHKPLLLLYVIGRYLNGSDGLVSFRAVEDPLKQLLVDFGPYRKAIHPELPFWHLYTDGFWELKNIETPKDRMGSASVKKKMLLAKDAHGGLSSSFYESLKNRRIAAEAISVLLNQNFPESIHEDILTAVGIDSSCFVFNGKRDSAFREEILHAYNYSCAICGFTSRIGYKLAGVEAAHIKWHQAGGPDTNPNGVALCSLHHKLFDLGMITFSKDYRILVSELANGSAMFKHIVENFHGSDINLPTRPEYQPAQNYVSWHVKQVFHPPGRYLKSA